MWAKQDQSVIVTASEVTTIWRYINVYIYLFVYF